MPNIHEAKAAKATLQQLLEAKYPALAPVVHIVFQGSALALEISLAAPRVVLGLTSYQGFPVVLNCRRAEG
jgi:hypothetical protein